MNIYLCDDIEHRIWNPVYSSLYRITLTLNMEGVQKKTELHVLGFDEKQMRFF